MLRFENYLRGHKVIFGREGGIEERVPECWTGSLPKMVNFRFVVTSQHPLETAASMETSMCGQTLVGLTMTSPALAARGCRRHVCVSEAKCVCVGGRGRVVASSTPCDLMVVLTSAGQSSVGYHRCVNTLSSKTHSVAQLAPRSRADRPRTASSDPETSS